MTLNLIRYLLPKLCAMNFVPDEVLDGEAIFLSQTINIE